MSDARSSRSEVRRLGWIAAVRIAVSLAALAAAYWLVPLRSAGTEFTGLAVALVVFGAVAAVQVPLIVRATHPTIRAVEALSLVVPVFLVIFARTYLAASTNDPAAFNEPLTRTDALYFTVTCLATVGFGDIVPVTQPMRLLVTAQILLDLVLIGVVVKLFVSAVRWARTDRRRSLGDH
ncbi:potassium channel family protein [Aeromicrobium duanguangcaii]|uniref:potassium channel family protein n=1 Tax=Aeromicrobium duanguangcaii TaxID=2968086 RepID=UPI002016C053|nr:potassium channel family protein [Aeromicrobium duanguangcaii]MCL3837111.1 ion channel [Aeromicrobium duanguangcaii]